MRSFVVCATPALPLDRASALLYDLSERFFLMYHCTVDCFRLEDAAS
jgi:hypothetical protein